MAASQQEDPVGRFQRTGEGSFRHGDVEAAFDPVGLTTGGISFKPSAVLRAGGRETTIAPSVLEVTVDDGLLVRVTTSGRSTEGHGLRATYDLHPTGNIHVYLRLELAAAMHADEIDLPRLNLDGISRLVTAAGSSALNEDGSAPLLEP